MTRWHRFSFLPLVALFVVAAGCASPLVQTQPQRLAFVKPQIDEILRKSMNCQEVTLDFQKTEQVGMEWFDLYVAQGCGYRSEFVTEVSQLGVGANTFTRSHSALGVSEADFRAAAESQLRKTAGFDLGCKELDFTPLHTILARLHNQHESTIGVAGCSKKATYRTRCTLQGYTAGRHEITCSAMANAAQGGP